MTDTIDPLAEGVPGLLRRVAPPSVPWPAGVVRTPEGAALLVDVDELSDCALGPPAEHVARPSEVYRTTSGHVALLTPLARPLAPAALDPGAAVTVAVSVLRGMREAGPGALGRWWLAEGGAPVFVPVRDGEDAVRSGLAVIRALAVPGMPAVFADLSADLGGREDLDDVTAGQWEQRLFAAAQPAAVTAPAADDPTRRRRRQQPVVRSGGALMRTFDGGVAAAVSDAAHSLRRTLRGRVSRRTLVVLTAATVGAVVLAVGLGLPESGPEAAPVATLSTIASAPLQEGAASPAPPAEGTTGDLAAIARALLTQLRGCGDASCRGGLLEDPARAVPAGAASGAAEVRLGVLDDLGGLVVIRADAPGERSQIVLLVSRDGKWLVRDVYDVADQP